MPVTQGNATQGSQWTEILSCIICFNTFNGGQHRPISLGCGHTVCRLCLTKLQKKCCPLDHSAISSDVNELPINYALLQLVGVAIPDTADEGSERLSVSERSHYLAAKSCIEQVAMFLKPEHTGTPSSLHKSMQRKLLMLLNCQLMEEEGRVRAIRAARSVGERSVADLLQSHQNNQQVSTNLWAAIRSRGCQFLGPAMQEEVLKLILLSLEDGSALSRKVLVMFVLQRLQNHEPQFQASKTAVGHVVQLLYRASVFKITQREGESSLMQLHAQYRTYDTLRRAHDAEIMQVAMETGLRISPDQWSSLLYGDSQHKSQMQSIIDKVQSPQTLVQSVKELGCAVQRSGDPLGLEKRLLPHLQMLAEIDPNPGKDKTELSCWKHLECVMRAVKQVIFAIVDYNKWRLQQRTNASIDTLANRTHYNPRYKTLMCRDLQQFGHCARGSSCTFAHHAEEMERYRGRATKTYSASGGQGAEGFAVRPGKPFSSGPTKPSMNAAPARTSASTAGPPMRSPPDKYVGNTQPPPPMRNSVRPHRQYSPNKGPSMPTSPSQHIMPGGSSDGATSRAGIATIIPTQHTTNITDKQGTPSPCSPIPMSDRRGVGDGSEFPSSEPTAPAQCSPLPDPLTADARQQRKLSESSLCSDPYVSESYGVSPPIGRGVRQNASIPLATHNTRPAQHTIYSSAIHKIDGANPSLVPIRQRVPNMHTRIQQTAAQNTEGSHHSVMSTDTQQLTAAASALANGYHPGVVPHDDDNLTDAGNNEDGDYGNEGGDSASCRRADCSSDDDTAVYDVGLKSHHGPPPSVAGVYYDASDMNTTANPYLQHPEGQALQQGHACIPQPRKMMPATGMFMAHHALPTSDSHYYLPGNILYATRGKNPQEQLRELHKRRIELKDQMNKINQYDSITKQILTSTTTSAATAVDTNTANVQTDVPREASSLDWSNTHGSATVSSVHMSTVSMSTLMTCNNVTDLPVQGTAKAYHNVQKSDSFTVFRSEVDSSFVPPDEVVSRGATTSMTSMMPSKLPTKMPAGAIKQPRLLPLPLRGPFVAPCVTVNPSVPPPTLQSGTSLSIPSTVSLSLPHESVNHPPLHDDINPLVSPHDDSSDASTVPCDFTALYNVHGSGPDDNSIAKSLMSHLNCTQASGIQSSFEDKLLSGDIIKRSPSPSWSSILEGFDRGVSLEREDEFIPFGVNSPSKYGPIMRMTRTKIENTVPVNVTASLHKLLNPVTAVTPLERGYPITSPVPTIYPEHKKPTEPHNVEVGPPATIPEGFLPPPDSVATSNTMLTDHQADPYGHMVAASLPTMLMSAGVLTTGTSHVSHNLWKLREQRCRIPTQGNGAPNESAIGEGDNNMIDQELRTLNQRMGSLQNAEDRRLMKELDAIELNILETERHMAMVPSMSNAAASTESHEQQPYTEAYDSHQPQYQPPQNLPEPHHFMSHIDTTQPPLHLTPPLSAAVLPVSEHMSDEQSAFVRHLQEIEHAAHAKSMNDHQVAEDRKLAERLVMEEANEIGLHHYYPPQLHNTNG